MDDEGLALVELFPQVGQAIDRVDPVETGLALEQLGFQVQWLQLWDGGEAMPVSPPPAGSVVIAVAAPDTGEDTIDPATDPLVVEGPLIIEVFDWVDEDASRRAHTHPRVSTMWEAMGPLCEDRGGRPSFEFPNLRRLQRA